jgi:MFS family permease
MPADSVYQTQDSHEPHGVRTPKKAAIASWIGSALEYYDFFIYETAAALVFGKIFFPSDNPATGILLALATFGVGYVARPVGAFVLGHVGDKFGRRTVLIFTLILWALRHSSSAVCRLMARSGCWHRFCSSS